MSKADIVKNQSFCFQTFFAGNSALFVLCVLILQRLEKKPLISGVRQETELPEHTRELWVRIGKKM